MYPKRGAPITVETIDWCLDQLALIMSAEDDEGATYLPIWDRLERERAALLASGNPRLLAARERAARIAAQRSPASL